MATKIIKLNRGDSYEVTFSIPKKDNYLEYYFLDEVNDVVYFAIMFPHQPFEKAFLIQGYTFEDQNPETGEILVKLNPSMTRHMQPGVYY